MRTEGMNAADAACANANLANSQSINYLRSIVAQKCERIIREIIIHCSATKEMKDFGAGDIRHWHLERGFNDIGYHYVVRLDGTIEPGRPLAKAGAHCLNHNRHSIGICYIGGLASDGRTPKDTRTSEQRQALLSLLQHLIDRYPQAKIHSHRDFAAKACPCFDATAEYAGLRPH